MLNIGNAYSGEVRLSFCLLKAPWRLNCLCIK